MRLLLYEEIFCVNIIRCPMWLNNTVSRRKRYRVYLRLYLPRPRPTRPRVPYVPRPIPDVPTSLPSRPQVPSPHTRVPMSPSPCPRPTFIHSRKTLERAGTADANNHSDDSDTNEFTVDVALDTAPNDDFDMDVVIDTEPESPQTEIGFSHTAQK